MTKPNSHEVYDNLIRVLESVPAEKLDMGKFRWRAYPDCGCLLHHAFNDSWFIANFDKVSQSFLRAEDQILRVTGISYKSPLLTLLNSRVFNYKPALLIEALKRSCMGESIDDIVMGER